MQNPEADGMARDIEPGQREREKRPVLAHKQRMMVPNVIWQAALEQSHTYFNTPIDTYTVPKRLRHFRNSNKFPDSGNQSGSRAACDMGRRAAGLKQKH